MPPVWNPFAGLTIAAAAVQLEAANSATVHPAQVGVQPPDAFGEYGGELRSIVWADLLGADQGPLTRAAAMALPAVARQRHLLAGTIARCPLQALRVDQVVNPSPLWMTRTDAQAILPPYHRMLWTIDDLIFHGWSLWSATRDSEAGLIAAHRIPYDLWEVEDTTGRILVGGEPVNADQVILIPGPHEGILQFGATAIRRAIANSQAASNAARNPSAYLELHYTGDEPIPDDERDALIQGWAKARRGENGGVAWTNKVLEVKEHGTHEAHLLIEGRNADAVDVSRLVSSPAAMADATSAGASLTYETTQGRNGQFLDYGLALYMAAVEARLSMDDVVPRGQRTAFDTTQLRSLAPVATGAPQED